MFGWVTQRAQPPQAPAPPPQPLKTKCKRKSSKSKSKSKSKSNIDTDAGRKRQAEALGSDLTKHFKPSVDYVSPVLRSLKEHNEARATYEEKSREIERKLLALGVDSSPDAAALLTQLNKEFDAMANLDNTIKKAIPELESVRNSLSSSSGSSSSSSKGSSSSSSKGSSSSSSKGSSSSSSSIPIEFDVKRQPDSVMEGTVLTQLEVEIYLNEFLSFFSSDDLENLFTLYFKTDAKGDHRKTMDSRWPLFTPNFFKKRVSDAYVKDEIESFYSNNPSMRRARPGYLERLYFALYDAIRVCHYNTIVAMQRYQWAVFFQNVLPDTSFSTKYNVLNRNFNDARIKEPLMKNLGPLLVMQLLRNGSTLRKDITYYDKKTTKRLLSNYVNTSTGRGKGGKGLGLRYLTSDVKMKRRTMFLSDAEFSEPHSDVTYSVYSSAEKSSDIPFQTLYVPSQGFRSWLNSLKSSIRINDANYIPDRGPSLYSLEALPSDIPYTVLNDDYLSLEKSDADEFEYGLVHMILNKIEPSQNTSYENIARSMFKKQAKTYPDNDVSIREEMLSITDGHMDSLLKIKTTEENSILLVMED